MSACDTKEKERNWQNTPSVYCQRDEHDAGCTWGPPLHPVTCKNADSSLSRHADVQSTPCCYQHCRQRCHHPTPRACHALKFRQSLCQSTPAFRNALPNCCRPCPLLRPFGGRCCSEAPFCGCEQANPLLIQAASTRGMQPATASVCMADAQTAERCAL
jgi:hypothetical protein